MVDRAPKYPVTEYRVVDKNDLPLVYQATDLVGIQHQRLREAEMDVRDLGGRRAGVFMRRGPERNRVRALAGTLSENERVVRIKATHPQLVAALEEQVIFVDRHAPEGTTSYDPSTVGDKAEKSARRTRPILRTSGKKDVTISSPAA